MMNYEIFKEVVKEKFMDYMPEKFKGMELVAEPVEKVNVTLDGIILREEGRNISPNGVCIPEPTDLNAQAPYSRYNESKPFINKIASINVEIPVIVSPIIIRFFLLNLSPHVPENIEITICGI